jgi:hypothetical protein
MKVCARRLRELKVKFGHGSDNDNHRARRQTNRN